MSSFPAPVSVPSKCALFAPCGNPVSRKRSQTRHWITELGADAKAQPWTLSLTLSATPPALDSSTSSPHSKMLAPQAPAVPAESKVTRAHERRVAQRRCARSCQPVKPRPSTASSTRVGWRLMAPHRGHQLRVGHCVQDRAVLIADSLAGQQHSTAPQPGDVSTRAGAPTHEAVLQCFPAASNQFIPQP